MTTIPQLTTLEPIAMHGPIEVQILIHVMLPSGQKANLRFQMEPGRLPTRVAMQEVLEKALSPESMEESSIPDGTRLMTKPEFVALVTTRETGQAIPVPGEQNWEPTTVEIPHHMLVHAVIGAGVPKGIAAEFAGRGLVYHSVVLDRHLWNEVKLQELPPDVLLAIYQRLV